MQQSKLIVLLRVLSKAQLQWCQQMLPALLAGKPEQLLTLFQELRHFAPTYKNAGLQSEKLTASTGIAPEKLARRQNELLRALEDCLLIKDMLDDPLASQLRLLEIFNELDLPKHYRQSVRRAERSLADYPYHDFELLNRKFKLAEQRERAEADYRRSHSERLQAASDALDRSYLAQKLRYLLEMVNLRQTIDVPYRLELSELVIQASKQALFADEPLIFLYRNTLQLMEDPENEALFFQLQDELAIRGEQLHPEILKQLYTYLLNHCTRRITRHRDTTYYEHYLRLNERLIQGERLLDQGELAPWRFSNLITVGLRTGRLEWARSFLKSYRDLLPDDFRENTYQFNLAHCLYYEKDYDNAQRLLQQLVLRDLLLAVATKNLLVKIYFETDQIELLLRFLENYRLYIYRQSLAKGKLRKQVGNFIATVRKLTRLPEYGKSARQKLVQELAVAGEILERDWIIQQLE
ncbi:MAG: hypothetical protein AAF433_17090 [Bacteroidota bacterium]